MLNWLFLLLLLGWIAVILAGRRVQRRLAGLDPALQARFRGTGATRTQPGTLLRAVIRGRFRDVPDVEFVRSCTVYRASLVLYFVALAVTIAAMVAVAATAVLRT